MAGLCGPALSLRLAPPAARAMSRRAAVASGLATMATFGRPALADASVRVEQWPGLEYLEPIYELSLSLDALVAVADNPERWPALRQRLKKFFGGGPLSERYYYAGLSLQYSDQIKYDDIDAFVQDDKSQRKQAMDDVLASMERLKGAVDEPAPDAASVVSNARAARKAMDAWLRRAPSADVRAADALFKAVRAADTNRDGVLSGSEYDNLSQADGATWKARVALVGD